MYQFKQGIPPDTVRQMIQELRWVFHFSWCTGAWMLSGIVLTVLLESFIPAGMALTIRNLINAATNIVRGVTDDTWIMYVWLVAGFALTSISSVVQLARHYLEQRLSDELNIQLSGKLLNHVNSLELAIFEHSYFQDMMRRAQDYTGEAFVQFQAQVLLLLLKTLQVTFLFAVLLYIEPLLLLLFPISIPYMLFQWRLARKLFEDEYQRVTKHRWRGYYTWHMTNASAVAEVKLLNLAPLFIKRLENLLTEFRDWNKKRYLTDFTGTVAFALISMLAVYLLFAQVLGHVIQGALTIGDIAVFGGSAVSLRTLIESILSLLGRIRRQLLNVSNLMAIFQLEPQIPTAGTQEFGTIQNALELQHVSFRYPGTDRMVLRDLSLHIKAGETLAIVGENGAGKTTLVKLIARLYEPDSGSILADGQCIQQLLLTQWQSRLAFTHQNYGQYEGTVFENIAFGNWEQLLGSPDGIKQIARQAGSHDMIEDMPEGYETLLGRNFGEYTPSGGQWQRIAITRALARVPTLLILDEPTANLDAKAEYELFQRLQSLASGRAPTLLISHRFSTISMADRIVVLDQGQIVEEGTHEQLLDLGGKYAQLYDLHQRQHNLPTPQSKLSI